MTIYARIGDAHKLGKPRDEGVYRGQLGHLSGEAQAFSQTIDGFPLPRFGGQAIPEWYIVGFNHP